MKLHRNRPPDFLMNCLALYQLSYLDDPVGLEPMTLCVEIVCFSGYVSMCKVSNLAVTVHIKEDGHLLKTKQQQQQQETTIFVYGQSKCKRLFNHTVRSSPSTLSLYY